MKKLAGGILFLILIGGSFSFSHAATYLKKIEGQTLLVQAPVITKTSTGFIAHSNHKTNKRVQCIYGDQVFHANTIVLKAQKIYLSGGFWGSLKKSTLSGKSLVYNLENDFFDSSEITLTSGVFQIKTGALKFYGEKIDFRKSKIGLTVIDLGIFLDEVEMFPGWAVLSNMKLGTDTQTYYQIPVWVIDLRRNAFEIPYPLPDVGVTNFRGNYIAMNNHYYWNENLYGHYAYGTSQWKGGMIGFGHIIRLGDQDQMYLGVNSWQVAKPQAKIEYNHSFMQLPYRKKSLTFGELLEYNKQVRDLDSSDLRATYTKREEISDEEIDRDLEFAYSGHFTLSPRLDLDLNLISGQLFEYSTQQKGLRTNSEFHFTYEYPFWFIDPLWWGIGYERSDYEDKPFTWQKVDGSVAWENSWELLLFGIKYTHYFYEHGGSPFIFDQKYSVPNNNIIYNLRFGKKRFHIGAKILSDTELNYIVDKTYYLTIPVRGWQVQMQYSTQREAFSAGVALEFF